MNSENKCVISESCFFYGAYKNSDDDQVQSWIKEYCHSSIRSNDCARHAYEGKHRMIPSADYGPTGVSAMKV